MKQTQAITGFTIIELTIYMGLLGILIAILSQVFLGILDLKIEAQQHTVVEQDARYIVSRIEYDIRRATEILSPAIGENASILQLTIDENGSDVLYEYALIGDQLILTVDGMSNQISSTASSVTRFATERIGNSGTVTNAKDTVQIFLTLKDTGSVSMGQTPYWLQTTVGIR